jgi:hypothetical protein
MQRLPPVAIVERQQGESSVLKVDLRDPDSNRAPTP